MRCEKCLYFQAEPNRKRIRVLSFGGLRYEWHATGPIIGGYCTDGPEDIPISKDDLQNDVMPTYCLLQEGEE